MLVSVRLVIARCQVDYAGRLTAHLPMAPRLILIKSDGSVSIHADDRAYKPLNLDESPLHAVELEAPEAGQLSVPVSEPISALGRCVGATGTHCRSCWVRCIRHLIRAWR
jgi:RecB family endonuclease NucS